MIRILTGSLCVLLLFSCDFKGPQTDMMRVYEEAIRRENRLNGEMDLRQFDGPLAIRVSYYPPAEKNVLPEIIVKALHKPEEQVFQWKYFPDSDPTNPAYWEEPLQSLRAREYIELPLNLQDSSLDYIRENASAILNAPYEQQQEGYYTGIYVGLEMKDENGFTSLLYQEPFTRRQAEFFTFMLMTSRSGGLPEDLANTWIDRIKEASE